MRCMRECKCKDAPIQSKNPPRSHYAMLMRQKKNAQDSKRQVMLHS